MTQQAQYRDIDSVIPIQMTQQAHYRHIDSVIPMLDDILNKHSIDMQTV